MSGDPVSKNTLTDSDKPVGSSYRWYALGLLFVIGTFNYIDRHIVVILQEPIKHDLGLSDAQLGAITGLGFAILYTFMALPIAWLADRSVRKYVISAALGTWSFFTALCGLANSFTSLLIFRMGVAVGEAGAHPTSLAIISDYFPRKERATAMAIFGLAIPAGVMIGFLSGGWLHELFGWRNAFIFVGIAGLAIIPIVLLTLREPPRGLSDGDVATQSDPRNTPSLLVVAKTLWAIKSFRYLMVACGLQAFTLHTILSWSVPFYMRVHGVSVGEVAIFLAVLKGIGGAIGTYFGGVAADRLAQQDVRWYMWLPAASAALLVPALLIQFLAPHLNLSLIAGMIAFTLMPVFIPPMNATGQSLVDANMRASTAATIVITTNLLGLGLGPFLVGAISDVLANVYGLGDHSIRYAVLVTLGFNVAAAFYFMKAAGFLVADMPPEKSNVTTASERT